MGIFSKIWKGVKNVFKGIAKVFEPILRPLGKLLDSGIGKAIMLGLSVFTLGSAMLAGGGAFFSTLSAGGPGSFINAFVEGGKAFVGSLTGAGAANGPQAGPTVEAANAANAAADAANLNVVAGGPVELAGQSGIASADSLANAAKMTGDTLQGATNAVTGAAPAAAGQEATKGLLSQAAAAGPGPTQALAKAGGELATRTAPAAEGSWLSKAAKAAGDFVKSEGGAQIVGSLVEGVGNYYQEKDRQQFEDRIRRQWGQGDKDAGIRQIRGQTARIGQLDAPSAQGIASASRNTANEGARRPTFDRAYGAGAGGG